MESSRFRFFCACVLVALTVTGFVGVPAAAASRTSFAELSKAPLVTYPTNASASAPIDIHASTGYVRSYPRDLIVNYSYAIAATGTSFQISIHVAQSFAYANVTNMTILVNPERPFTYSMGYDDLGNDVLTIMFDSSSPLGQFYLTVLQHVTVYAIKYTIDPAKVGSYDKSSELYKVYTQPAQYIQSDNPEIMATSRQVVAGETNPYLAALKIQKYVAQHITYDNAFQPWSAEHEGALFALHAGRGVCRHYPALFAALARAAGIPTVDMWGSTPTDGGSLTDPGDLKHNWVQFYLPNYGWVPADPAWQNTGGIDWFGRLQDNSHVPVESVNYVYQTAWWSGGDAKIIVKGGELSSGEEPTVSRPPSTIATSLPQGISWSTRSDTTGVIDQSGKTVGNLGLPYLDVTDLQYGFVGGSLYFRFDLHGPIPSQIDTAHVGGVWYQVLIDVDSDSSTGYLWSSDFTPDYVLDVMISSRSNGVLYSSVSRYAGSGSDWLWTVFDYDTQQPVLAGGVGSAFFVLSCLYRDISVSEGSVIRFFARSGAMYNGQVYNDIVPSMGTVTMTLPSEATTTFSTSTLTVTSTPTVSSTSVLSSSSIIVSSTSSIVSPLTTSPVNTTEMLLFLVLVIAVVGIAVVVTKRRRSTPKRES